MPPPRKRLPYMLKMLVVSILAQAQRTAGAFNPAAARGRSQPTLAVGCAPFTRVGGQLIPELARDRFVLLVEPFTIIGVFAHANLGAASQQRFAEPVRVGER